MRVRSVVVAAALFGAVILTACGGGGGHASTGTAARAPNRSAEAASPSTASHGPAKDAPDKDGEAEGPDDLLAEFRARVTSVIGGGCWDRPGGSNSSGAYETQSFFEWAVEGTGGQAGTCVTTPVASTPTASSELLAEFFHTSMLASQGASDAGPDAGHIYRDGDLVIVIKTRAPSQLVSAVGQVATDMGMLHVR